MARVPLVDPNSDDAEPAARAILQRVSGGRYHPNVYRAMANHPDALETFAAFGRVLSSESSLAPAHWELAYLTASVTNNCHY